MKSGHLNLIGAAVTFFLFWVAVSGSLKWPQLLAGLAAAVFVTYFNRSLLINAADRPPVNLRNTLWFFAYLLKLLADIVRANFQVARIVLHPHMPISPGMVTIRPNLEKDASRVLLANSITLTPGTLTVLVDDRELLIHTLTEESGEAISKWPLTARLEQMEEAGS